MPISWRSWRQWNRCDDDATVPLVTGVVKAGGLEIGGRGSSSSNVIVTGAGLAAFATDGQPSAIPRMKIGGTSIGDVWNMSSGNPDDG